jgi:hypothetical protein
MHLHTDHKVLVTRPDYTKRTAAPPAIAIIASVAPSRTARAIAARIGFTNL